MLKAPSSSPPIRAGSGARALYLGSRERKRVACTAEALVITNARGQILRYPLVRVARIVSSAELVDWSGAALALCMRAGISITWLDSKGHALGSCYPQLREATPFGTAVELWIEGLTKDIAAYGNWLRARRMEVLIRWGSQRSSAVTPQEWESRKREWVYGRQYETHLPMGLRSLCLAYISGQLAASGLAPWQWGPNVESVNLDEDLCELLWAEMNLTSGSMVDKADADMEMSVVFERWCTLNASALSLHLSSLHRTALKALHT